MRGHAPRPQIEFETKIDNRGVRSTHQSNFSARFVDHQNGSVAPALLGVEKVYSLFLKKTECY